MHRLSCPIFLCISLFFVVFLLPSFFSLLFPVALGTGGAYLLVRYASVGEWIYALFILIGFFAGLISMIRFIMIASHAVARLEQEEKERRKQKK